MTLPTATASDDDARNLLDAWISAAMPSMDAPPKRHCLLVVIGRNYERSVADLAHAVWCPRAAVKSELKELIALGLVERRGEGRYALTDAGRARVEVILEAFLRTDAGQSLIDAFLAVVVDHHFCRRAS
jgi:DNA-binding MarR family transcriptional regulator